MDIKEEFEFNLERVTEDVQDVTQQMNILCEYRSISKDNRFFEDYGIYFDTIYSYLSNYLLLSFYKLYDDSGADCISIYTLKKFIERHFDQVFTNSKLEKFKNEFLFDFKLYFHRIYPIIQKVKHIRNKCGLAHGMINDFSVIISFEEMELLLEYTQKIINKVRLEYQIEPFLFGQGIIKIKTLRNLVEDNT